MTDWLRAVPTAFGGKSIHRLGLATNYGIDAAGVRHAMERGVNVFLWTTRGTATWSTTSTGCATG